jgi:hypothetical protein
MMNRLNRRPVTLAFEKGAASCVLFAFCGAHLSWSWQRRDATAIRALRRAELVSMTQFMQVKIA